MAIAWPPRDAVESGQYRVGRAIEQAPSVALAREGSLTVVFGTTERGTAPGDTASMMVSFADEVVLGDGERLDFQTKRNWVMPLRDDEALRGSSTIRSRTAFFTTLERAVDENQCVGGVARLYAVDYGRTQERYNTVDGRTLNVVPRLPPIKTEWAVTLSLMVLRSYYQRESHLTGWLLYVAHHVPKTKSLQPKSS